MKKRLDQAIVEKGLSSSRNNAATLIKLGKVKVNGKKINKAGFFVAENAKIEVSDGEKYVSRAGYKLASVADQLNLDFRGKTVLDVGSSTGGFTDYALQHGAKKVVAVDVGNKQLHSSLINNTKIDLYENTDIRSFKMDGFTPDIVLIDVSFISINQVLPSVKKLSSKKTLIVAMLKPQFEVGDKHKHKGVVKNSKLRREIMKNFESVAKQDFYLIAKADSKVTGDKGNLERFYLLGVTS